MPATVGVRVVATAAAQAGRCVHSQKGIMFDVNHDASLLAAALHVRAVEPREGQSVFGLT